MSRLLKVTLLGLAPIIIGFAALVYVRVRLAAPVEKLKISNSSAERWLELPPGEPVPIKFTTPDMTQTEVRAFLAANFTVVRRMADVPVGIRTLYIMNDRPRIAIADPGQRWQPTDVITDPYIPRRRLIFAGIARGRAFIYYEQGGIGYSRVLELFSLKKADVVVGLWRGHCGSTKIAAGPTQLAEDCTW